LRFFLAGLDLDTLVSHIGPIGTRHGALGMPGSDPAIRSNEAGAGLCRNAPPPHSIPIERAGCEPGFGMADACGAARQTETNMNFHNYDARAELYLGSDKPTAIAQGGRPFATAAQALRFAFEEAAPVSLHGAMLKVGDTAFSGADFAALYRSPDFPLPRKPGARRPRRPRHDHSGSLYAAARHALARQPELA
jgi:hypothetical protein